MAFQGDKWVGADYIHIQKIYHLSDIAKPKEHKYSIKLSDEDNKVLIGKVEIKVTYK